MPNNHPSLDKATSKKIEKPWGHEILFAHTDRYAGKLLFIKKGHRLSLQYHVKKDEAFYVQTGRAQVDLETADGEKSCVILEPGDALRLVPGIRHRTAALEDTVIFEVSTAELDDVVRLSDDYGRTPEK
jgi:mannose-6-phosphate isomerase-like protein (cupin superfamily)